MSIRQIALDTETTGLRVEDGHRIIEIGCIEMIDRKLTNNKFHCYLNPEREIEAAAVAIHGITNEFLADKPVFSLVAKQFMDFVTNAELIIHNASFDLSFLNYELLKVNQEYKALTTYCKVIDTLQMARRLHVGQRNSLDALCKRYGVDHSKRDLHGALLDADLLAKVYLAMTGGQSSFFDLMTEAQNSTEKRSKTVTIMPGQQYHLTVLEAEADELSRHQAYLESMQLNGKCLWLEDS
jgi:DNA polymerase III subunit epsilon